MARIAQIRSRVLPISVLVLSLLFPSVALAALLLGLSYWLLAARRRRAKRPLLNS